MPNIWFVAESQPLLSRNPTIDSLGQDPNREKMIPVLQGQLGQMLGLKTKKR